MKMVLTLPTKKIGSMFSDFKLLILVPVSLLAVIFSFLSLDSHSSVLGVEKRTEEVLDAPQPIKTNSRFQTKIFSSDQVIAAPVKEKDDPDREIGDDATIQEGVDGKKTTITKVSYYQGEEYSREVVSTEVTPPREKIIAKGTKIVWRSFDTSIGQISYWRKIRMWATSYDSRCNGCDETTAIGLRAGKGVVAVDPQIIKLGSRVYIPGYGLAIAGDTGGAIKGAAIDLGFDDSRLAGWISHFVDVYLIN